jgi:penicillin-binding protein 1A
MHEPPTSIIPDSPARGPRFVRSGNGAPPQPPAPPKPKLKKLRLALVVLGLSVLALVSTVFGMLMAVASDLPSLDNKAEFRAAENSILYPDDRTNTACKKFDPDKCPRIAKLTGNLNRILVDEGDISPNLKNAVIAIEDRRFYSHNGVDYAGIARALWQDIRRRSAAQGGSTITQQFVKNALSAQGERTVFQKLREAALAYHLERKWSKEKILTQYLNTVYFGNGAYGVEAAARTYFGDGDETDATDSTAGVTYDPAASTTEEELDPDRREVRTLAPAEAALLAGMISSPSMYDPVEHPAAAQARRDLVLSRMLEQRMITRGQYEEAVRQSLPDEQQVDPPDLDSDQPYFTSWLTQQLVDKYKAATVFGGGLKIKTTIDPELQAAAEQAVAGRLAGVGPSASLVAIDNKTGAIKAMVGGTDFDARPFNLATNGHRQPGSAIKPFILVRALADGVDPNSTWASQPKEFPVPGSSKEVFPVSNYEDSYLGVASLWSATATSDNSVFAELGLKVGTKRIARLAKRMGIRTELSTNPAMTLGGLEEGVTPLEMAYAYSTIANEGLRKSSDLNPGGTGPVGVEQVIDGGGDKVVGKVTTERVFPEQVGELAKEMLHLVVTSGTGEAAQVGDEYIWGKTGTTENYGDAWFAGGNDDLTVAIWVGYADKVQPMEYEHAGGPVAGGTFPAEIFHDFMASWIELREARRAALDRDDEDSTEDLVTPTTPVDPNVVPETDVAPEQEVPDDGGGGEAPTDQTEATPAPETPVTPEPETPTPVEPTPAPTQPQDGGTGGGTAPP